MIDRGNKKKGRANLNVRLGQNSDGRQSFELDVKIMAKRVFCARNLESLRGVVIFDRLNQSSSNNIIKLINYWGQSKI